MGGRIDHRLDLIGIRDIGVDKPSVELSGQRFTELVLQVGNQHPGTLARQAAGRSRSQPGSTTGHDRSYSFDVHLVLPSSLPKASAPSWGRMQLVTWILITNDDGIDSPALVPLAQALNGLGPIRVVVPDGERSWIGKAITRHDPVSVHATDRSGVEMISVSGYPADCVQLGIHTLFDTPPAVVVSGINIGYNHGAAYIQSSGTVGAAIEASLAAIPAVAFSAGSHSRPWEEWRRWVHTTDAVKMWERLAGVASHLVAELLKTQPTNYLINVNFPDTATMATRRVVTAVAETGYERLFSKSGDVYVHDFGGGVTEFAGMDGTDVEAAERGHIAITPIRPAHTGTLDPGVAAALLA